MNARPMVVGVVVIISACHVLTSLWTVDNASHRAAPCQTSIDPATVHVHTVILNATDAPMRSVPCSAPLLRHYPHCYSENNMQIRTLLLFLIVYFSEKKN